MENASSLLAEAMTTAMPIAVDVPAATSSLVAAIASTTTSALAAASTAVTAAGSPDDSEGECRLLGPFALIVQLALGGLALLSLVYKRWKERPQRPVKIWFFDVSKQVFGSVLVHIANVFMSMLTSGRFSIKLDPGVVQTAQRLLRRDGDDAYVPNPCSFYLLNLAIDTTLGIPILLILLRIFTGLVAYTPLGKPAESIKSGNYGDPPKVWWWLKQSVIYFCGLFGMKICVLVLFLMMPWISKLGDWALGWTDGNERLQIVFVMMLFPLIMNAMQYYIIDTFIKNKEETDYSGHERLAQEDRDEGRDPFDDSLADSDIASSDDEEEERAKTIKAKATQTAQRRSRESDDEYDPDLDGQTVIGSGRSQDERGKKILPKELFPKE